MADSDNSDRAADTATVSAATANGKPKFGDGKKVIPWRNKALCDTLFSPVLKLVQTHRGTVHIYKEVPTFGKRSRKIFSFSPKMINCKREST